MARQQIDEKTTVPIGWVFAGLTTIVVVVIAGAFKVASVDYRLQRIEERLGIPYHATTLESDAHANPSH